MSSLAIYMAIPGWIFKSDFRGLLSKIASGGTDSQTSFCRMVFLSELIAFAGTGRRFRQVADLPLSVGAERLADDLAWITK